MSVVWNGSPKMLVLKRRKGEKIVIDERITIQVIDSGNGSCRLAIEAPKSVPIRRAELPPFVEDIVRETAECMGIAG
jgi:carbon storage regulator